MSKSPNVPDDISRFDQPQDDSVSRDRPATASASPASRGRTSSNATDSSTGIVGRLRSASTNMLEANVPGGMWSATGAVVSKAPTLQEIRRGSYSARRESDPTTPVAVGPESGTMSTPGKEIRHRDSRAASSPKMAPIPDADDGLPSNVFGRPELADQSFVPGQRASIISQRIPKLAVKRRDSQEAIGSEVFQDAVESQSDTILRTTKAKNTSTEPFPALDEDSDLEDELQPKRRSKNVDALLGRTPIKPISALDRESSETGNLAKPIPNEEGIYPNGYSFPKPKPWKEATLIGFKAFLRFTFTPMGFFIVLYALNVVAWGGMLFLLLCNASPAMCQLGNGTSDCNDIDSPRRVWVEIDSQVVNALFCVTGFGLIPWRFRDFYYLLKWRIGKNEHALRKLAGYHNGWFRLPNSDRLPIKDFRESQLDVDESNAALPYPLKKTPGPPLTGARATPTALWKMDFVVWAFVWNTFLQAVLSGFMWGLNRYNRPSWSTGLFVALACLVAAGGGLTQFLESKKIKNVEGVPLEVQQEYHDVEKGLKKNKSRD